MDVRASKGERILGWRDFVAGEEYCVDTSGEILSTFFSGDLPGCFQVLVEIHLC